MAALNLILEQLTAEKLEGRCIEWQDFPKPGYFIDFKTTFNTHFYTQIQSVQPTPGDSTVLKLSLVPISGSPDTRVETVSQLSQQQFFQTQHSKSDPKIPMVIQDLVFDLNAAGHVVFIVPDETRIYTQVLQSFQAAQCPVIILDPNGTDFSPADVTEILLGQAKGLSIQAIGVSRFIEWVLEGLPQPIQGQASELLLSLVPPTPDFIPLQYFVSHPNLNGHSFSAAILHQLYSFHTHRLFANSPDEAVSLEAITGLLHFNFSSLPSQFIPLAYEGLLRMAQRQTFAPNVQFCLVAPETQEANIRQLIHRTQHRLFLIGNHPRPWEDQTDDLWHPARFFGEQGIEIKGTMTREIAFFVPHSLLTDPVIQNEPLQAIAEQAPAEQAALDVAPEFDFDNLDFELSFESADFSLDTEPLLTEPAATQLYSAWDPVLDGPEIAYETLTVIESVLSQWIDINEDDDFVGFEIDHSSSAHGFNADNYESKVILIPENDLEDTSDRSLETQQLSAGFEGLDFLPSAEDSLWNLDFGTMEAVSQSEDESGLYRLMQKEVPNTASGMPSIAYTESVPSLNMEWQMTTLEMEDGLLSSMIAPDLIETVHESVESIEDSEMMLEAKTQVGPTTVYEKVFLENADDNEDALAYLQSLESISVVEVPTTTEMHSESQATSQNNNMAAGDEIDWELALLNQATISPSNITEATVPSAPPADTANAMNIEDDPLMGLSELLAMQQGSDVSIVASEVPETAVDTVAVALLIVNDDPLMGLSELLLEQENMLTEPTHLSVSEDETASPSAVHTVHHEDILMDVSTLLAKHEQDVKDISFNDGTEDKYDIAQPHTGHHEDELMDLSTLLAKHEQDAIDINFNDSVDDKHAVSSEGHSSHHEDVLMDVSALLAKHEQDATDISFNDGEEGHLGALHKYETSNRLDESEPSINDATQADVSLLPPSMDLPALEEMLGGFDLFPIIALDEGPQLDPSAPPADIIAISNIETTEMPDTMSQAAELDTAFDFNLDSQLYNDEFLETSAQTEKVFESEQPSPLNISLEATDALAEDFDLSQWENLPELFNTPLPTEVVAAAQPPNMFETPIMTVPVSEIALESPEIKSVAAEVPADSQPTNSFDIETLSLDDLDTDWKIDFESATFPEISSAESHSVEMPPESSVPLGESMVPEDLPELSFDLDNFESVAPSEDIPIAHPVTSQTDSMVPEGLSDLSFDLDSFESVTPSEDISISQPVTSQAESMVPEDLSDLSFDLDSFESNTIPINSAPLEEPLPMPQAVSSTEQTPSLLDDNDLDFEFDLDTPLSVNTPNADAATTLLQNHRMQPASNVVAFRPGEQVFHQRYGQGVIKRVITMDEHQVILNINFDGIGKRLLDPTLTPLEKVS